MNNERRLWARAAKMPGLHDARLAAVGMAGGWRDFASDSPWTARFLRGRWTLARWGPRIDWINTSRKVWPGDDRAAGRSNYAWETDNKILDRITDRQNPLL